jgi:hypothetical protein
MYLVCVHTQVFPNLPVFMIHFAFKHDAARLKSTVWVIWKHFGTKWNMTREHTNGSLTKPSLILLTITRGAIEAAL